MAVLKCVLYKFEFHALLKVRPMTVVKLMPLSRVASAAKVSRMVFVFLLCACVRGKAAKDTALALLSDGQSISGYWWCCSYIVPAGHHVEHRDADEVAVIVGYNWVWHQFQQLSPAPASQLAVGGVANYHANMLVIICVRVLF